MIKNERQYRITNAAAAKFRAALAVAEKNLPRSDYPKWLGAKAEIEAMKSQLQSLETELKTYQNLRSAKGKKSLCEPLEHFGALLVQARIARGWSQRELGERIGVAMQQIQKHEANFYETAGWERIAHVLQALGATGEVRLRLVDLPDMKQLERPAVAVKAKGGNRI